MLCEIQERMSEGTVAVKVLVVEDNPDNSQLVTWILEDEGYEVECAETGEMALVMAEQSDFDIILMDISLPGIDGKETTRRLRKDANTSDTPIVALTAHAVEEEQKEIRDSGVDDLLTKPIDEDLLVKMMQDRFPNH